jgi:hypothetical protein
MVRVQKIRVPDTGSLSWIVIDGEHVPVGVVNEYLVYLHRLGRSPNTVRLTRIIYRRSGHIWSNTSATGKT